MLFPKTRDQEFNRKAEYIENYLERLNVVYTFKIRRRFLKLGWKIGVYNKATGELIGRRLTILGSFDAERFIFEVILSGCTTGDLSGAARVVAEWDNKLNRFLRTPCLSADTASEALVKHKLLERFYATTQI